MRIRSNRSNKSMLKMFYVLFLLMIVGGVYSYGFRTYYNSGGSMAPTVSDGQLLVVNKIYYDFTPVERYDIVALWDTKEKENLIKRIVGLPNETVELRNGKIFIDGEPIQHDPMEKTEGDWQLNFGPHKLKPNTYFYIGDDRDESIWGIVQQKNIAGKVVWK